MFIMVSLFKHGHSVIESIDTSALNRIIGMGSWKLDANDLSNLAYQQIFIKGELKTFSKSFRNYPPNINDDNAAEVASIMYLALGCKCIETIIDMLNSLLAGISEKNYNGEFPMESIFRGMKLIVLKIVSLLFDFTEIAPNVFESFEPDILKVSMLLSIHIHLILKSISDTETSVVDEQIIIFQLINIIERYPILNCSTPTVRLKPTSINTVENIDNSISDFNNFYDNTGLSSSEYLKYDIGIIIHQMSNELHFLLYSQPRLVSVKTVKREKSIFLYQKSVHNVIMHIIYQLTTMPLKELETMIIRTNSLANLGITETEKISDTNKIYFMDKSLIPIFEKALTESKRMEFPTDFISHINLILKIMKEDKLLMDRNYLNVVFTKNYENLVAFSGSNKDIMKNMPKNIGLHEFIKQISSITLFKYFNRIFKLLRDTFEVDEFLIKVSNFIEISIPNDLIKQKSTMKNAIMSLYAHSYYIQLNVSDNIQSEKKIEYFKELLSNVLNIMYVMISLEKSKTQGKIRNLLHHAFDYLNYNLLHYRTTGQTTNSGNILEKLARISCFVTNLIDKYQMFTYIKPIYRDVLYKHFAASNREFMIHLDAPKNSLNKYFTKNHKFEADEDKTKIIVDNLLYKRFINDSKNTIFVKSYWKGELKTIQEISVEMAENTIDLSSYPKYVHAFSKWIFSALFYTIIDIIDFLIAHNDLISEYQVVFDLYNSEFERIIFSNYWRVVKNSLQEIYVSNDITLLALKTMLEETLDNYNIVNIQRDTNKKDIDRYNYTERFKEVLATLVEVFPEKTNIQLLKLKSMDLK